MFCNLVEHLFVLGKAADLVFVPDLRAVDVHVEHAAATLDDARFDVKLILDCLRQTGGRG